MILVGPAHLRAHRRAAPRFIGAIALCALAALCVGGGIAMAQDNAPGPAAPTAERPAVLELFTSQGCSSCPPADALLARLAKNPNLIAISLPVDLWDYNGWRDTFATRGHTNRQQAYARMRGDGKVYTPQIVVDGVEHVVGSDEAAIMAATRSAFGKAGALSVPMAVTPSATGYVVSIGPATAQAPRSGVLMLVRLASRREVSVGRGENSGKTLVYTNVARSAQRLAVWTGAPITVEAPRATLESPDTDSWAIILQAGDQQAPGPILAAFMPTRPPAR